MSSQESPSLKFSNQEGHYQVLLSRLYEDSNGQDQNHLFLIQDVIPSAEDIANNNIKTYSHETINLDYTGDFAKILVQDHFSYISSSDGNNIIVSKINLLRNELVNSLSIPLSDIYLAEENRFSSLIDKELLHLLFRDSDDNHRLAKIDLEGLEIQEDHYIAGNIFEDNNPKTYMFTEFYLINDEYYLLGHDRLFSYSQQHGWQQTQLFANEYSVNKVSARLINNHLYTGHLISEQNLLKLCTTQIKQIPELLSCHNFTMNAHFTNASAWSQFDKIYVNNIFDINEKGELLLFARSTNFNKSIVSFTSQLTEFSPTIKEAKFFRAHHFEDRKLFGGNASRISAVQTKTKLIGAYLNNQSVYINSLSKDLENGTEVSQVIVNLGVIPEKIKLIEGESFYYLITQSNQPELTVYEIQKDFTAYKKLSAINIMASHFEVSAINDTVYLFTTQDLGNDLSSFDLYKINNSGVSKKITLLEQSDFVDNKFGIGFKQNNFYLSYYDKSGSQITSTINKLNILNFNLNLEDHWLGETVESSDLLDIYIKSTNDSVMFLSQKLKDTQLIDVDYVFQSKKEINHLGVFSPSTRVLKDQNYYYLLKSKSNGLIEILKINANDYQDRSYITNGKIYNDLNFNFISFQNSFDQFELLLSDNQLFLFSIESNKLYLSESETNSGKNEYYLEGLLNSDFLQKELIEVQYNEDDANNPS
ncbi:hypothetical protein MJH12_01740, partial [bacterium]|nr:hypothetical protein [bacterium]